MTQTRFEGGVVATLGEKNHVIWNGSVVVDGEKVAAIGDAADLRKHYPEAKPFDCAGKIVLPGLINAHHHFYSTMARGMCPPGEPASNFVEILERLWWKVDRALTDEDVLLSAQIPVVECIRNGVTTVIDHHASPAARKGSLDLVAKAAKKGGIRLSTCYEVSDRNGGAKEGIKENERFIKKCRKRSDGMAVGMMGLHASFTVSNETVERCAAVARENGVGCHIHVAEDLSDRKDSEAKHGVPCVKRLHRLGATGERSMFIHCIHVDDEEMDLLASTKTIATHQPESNMNNAVGCAKALKMMKKGVLVGLGTDGMTSDMLLQMRVAYLLHRHDARDPRVAFCEAPQMLLGNNAEIARRQFGLPLGVLSEGGPADMAILDYCPPTPLSEANLLGHLIFGLYDATVDTTVCAGKVLMKGKKIRTFDEEEVAARCRALAPKMWERVAAL